MCNTNILHTIYIGNKNILQHYCKLFGSVNIYITFASRKTNKHITLTTMTTYFTTIREIVLSKASKDAKIKKLQDDLKCTRYEANHYYQLVMHCEGDKGRDLPSAPKSFTMGIEIECFGFNKSVVREALMAKGVKSIETGYDHNDQKEAYKLGHDGSINGNQPCEVVSPILRNLKSLKMVCEVINEAGAQVNKSCGMHIHFGAEKFTLTQWVRIIKNYAAIEGIIDSFMAASRRGNSNGYSKSIIAVAANLPTNPRSFDEIERTFHDHRYYKVNVMSYRRHKTIEFRQHQGTTDFTKIKAWAEFLAALIKYSLTNETIITATSIDDLPFLTAKQKAYYNNRKEQLNR